MELYELAQEYQVAPLPGHPSEWPAAAIRDFRTLRFARYKARQEQATRDTLWDTVKVAQARLRARLRKGGTPA